MISFPSSSLRLGGKKSDVKNSDQFHYLCKYFEKLLRLGGKDKIYFLAEPEYIDRDFIDDFARFYSRCKRSYTNKCLRIHFFTCEVNLDLLASIIGGLQSEQSERTEYRKLQENYLGFTVIKPLAKPFVGRTVLRVYPKEAEGTRERHYPCTREYEVNLVGIPLKVKGLAFQQQDATIAACATTAIWCALNRASFDAKFHIPTPGEITESATRYRIEHGRPIPSSGLSIAQICEGIRSCGLAPELINVSSATTDYLKEVLHCYLNSEIPLIGAIRFYEKIEKPEGIRYKLAGIGHAITFLGYSLNKSLSGMQPMTEGLDVQTSFAALQMDGLYAHDDNLGPYLKIEFATQEFLNAHLSPDEEYKEGCPIKKAALQEYPHIKIRLDRGEYEFRLAWLTHLIAPLYPKLRLPYAQPIRRESTRRLATFDYRILSQHDWSTAPFSPRLENLTLEYAFVRGKDYLRKLQKELSEEGFTPRLILKLLEPLRLPRQVGVCEVYRRQDDGSKKPLLDLLFDTTESRLGWPIFAVILKHPILLPFEENLCAFFRVAQVYFPR